MEKTLEEPKRDEPKRPDETPAQVVLIGTDNQIAWAGQIRSAVHGEFDRVARALEARAGTQGGTQAARSRSDTLAMIGILEEKRTEVMANDDAGYFIRE